MVGESFDLRTPCEGTAALVSVEVSHRGVRAEERRQVLVVGKSGLLSVPDDVGRGVQSVRARTQAIIEA